MPPKPGSRERRYNKTNVSDVASSFVGRRADLDAIASRVNRGARLVTVTGPGGVGKTRVALRFAESVAKSYSARAGGGTWFCDLTEVRSVLGLVAAVASVLGVTKGPRSEEVRILDVTRALAARGRTLLVLDNFEQLVKEGAAVVATWIREAPLVTVLVTSRVALGRPGEELWPLDGLPEDEAAALFLGRAEEIRPGQRARASEATVIADIVSALNGMPLAIELAASRMAVLSAEGVRDRLRRPLDLLVNPHDDTRHASMRRTILESVELLHSDDRRAFAASSVFRNGFTLDAVEAILGADGIARVEVLCRSSLLRAVPTDPSGALRFLFFETIREIAVELGASLPEMDGIRDLHAMHFGVLASELGRSANLENLGPSHAKLAREEDNLRQAHAWALQKRDSRLAFALALGLDVIFSSRGIVEPRLRLLTDTIALGATDAHLAGSGELAALTVARGVAHREAGQVARARADFEVGYSVALAAERPEIAARALLRLGELIEVAGQTSAAHARFAEALSILGRAEESSVTDLLDAEAHLRIGHTHRREGALDLAEAAVGMATDGYRRLGHDEGLASSLYEAAVIAMFEERRDVALARFDEGIRIARRASLEAIGAALTTARGGLLQELGRTEEALAHHADAARVFRELGTRYRETSALYYLGTAYLDAGDAAEADRILSLALARVQGVGAPRYEALIYGGRAIARQMLGDLASSEGALAKAEQALAACETEKALGATIAIHRLTLSLHSGGSVESLSRADAWARAHPSDDSRFAVRMLRAITHPESRATPLALVVYPEAKSFRLPHAVTTVDLSRRAPLRAIVKLLAVRRRESPGEVVAMDDILRAAWPGEKIGVEAAMNRAYVALATLRKLGLRDVLLTSAGGYLLTPSVAVVFAERSGTDAGDPARATGSRA
jgi:predicted ATPase